MLGDVCVLLNGNAIELKRTFIDYLKLFLRHALPPETVPKPKTPACRNGRERRRQRDAGAS